MLADRFLAKASPSQAALTSEESVMNLSLYRPYSQSRVDTPSALLIAHLPLPSTTLAPFARTKLPQYGKNAGSLAKPKTRVWPLPVEFSLTHAVKSSWF